MLESKGEYKDRKKEYGKNIPKTATWNLDSGINSIYKVVRGETEKTGKFKHLGAMYLFYDRVSREAIEIESTDPYKKD